MKGMVVIVVLLFLIGIFFVNLLDLVILFFKNPSALFMILLFGVPSLIVFIFGWNLMDDQELKKIFMECCIFNFILGILTAYRYHRVNKKVMREERLIDKLNSLK